MKNICFLLKSLIVILFVICSSQDRLRAQNNFAKTGTFLIGCNYWASHSGSHMWRDWRPEIIEADFKQLSQNGIKILRVFPLWPDFQPIYQIYGGEGSKKYITFKDGPLPQTGAGSNGVSEGQLLHFETLTNLAKKYHLKLVVGLITGWMSGQLYVPPALEGKNILTDAEALAWQQKFVTTFVKRFKNNEAIVAWDFGNECNVMSKVQNHYEAYVWSSVISGAIRASDQTRPIVSGMHSLNISSNADWRIEDQAALTDVLTTHPYSLWTPYASQDAINTIRTVLHGAAETNMYEGIGGKPCLIEETGVMGPMTGGENEKAAFARVALFSNWANDCKGTFWWCAYDQSKLAYPPYEFASVELELGLIKENRELKPVIAELKNFSSFLDKLPFKELPGRKKDAVCILTENQDSWAVAYSSYVLAKQAGFDFEFQKAGQNIKDASLYLLPSLKGIDAIFKTDWEKLLTKVKNGSSLYISLDDAYLPSLSEPLSIEFATNVKRRGLLRYLSKLPSGDSLNFSTPAERKYSIKTLGSTVLAFESDVNPVFIKANYGKGKIFLLTFPLEKNISQTTGAFDKGQPQYNFIYKQVAEDLINDRIITQQDPYVVCTEHSLNDQEKVIILINYDPADAVSTLIIKRGWEISKCIYGPIPLLRKVVIKGNNALVLIVKKQVTNSRKDFFWR